MKAPLLRDRSARAERHVAHGEECVARRRVVITELERQGFDTATAKALLATFEGLQEMYVAHRDRYRRELGG